MSRPKPPLKRDSKKNKSVHSKKKTNDKSNYLNCSLFLPESFIILCGAAGISPEAMINGFVHDISFVSFQREQQQLARNFLVEYFIAKGYGKNNFSETEWRLFFTDLNALCFAWPSGTDTRTKKIAEQWRKSFYLYLRNKWGSKSIVGI